METVDLEDLGLELLLIAALHDEAERLASELPEPATPAKRCRGSRRQGL
ncbi:hypothetical protein [Sphaerisporangium sp. TRM90804]|nr:hypothetical protein [Sphaerisporangium sp. TRM90804]MDH2427568.1 hypothetical protein [Sphaerisporangium sp. TRM90804]